MTFKGLLRQPLIY